MVVGHTPSGSACAVLRSNGREVISADTNYATSSGTRGDNLVEVLIENNRARLKVWFWFYSQRESQLFCRAFMTVRIRCRGFGLLLTSSKKGLCHTIVLWMKRLLERVWRWRTTIDHSG